MLDHGQDGWGYDGWDSTADRWMRGDGSLTYFERRKDVPVIHTAFSIDPDFTVTWYYIKLIAVEFILFMLALGCVHLTPGWSLGGIPFLIMATWWFFSCRRSRSNSLRVCAAFDCTEGVELLRRGRDMEGELICAACGSSDLCWQEVLQLARRLHDEQQAFLAKHG